MTNPDVESLASMLRALGDPTRLAIFEFLLERCCAAMPDSPAASASEVCCAVTGIEKITPTVSHHIKELRSAGLVLVTRAGRRRQVSVNSEAVDRLAAYFRRAAEIAPRCCTPSRTNTPN
ncbi:MAG: winged helix-turn-helix transcriptional regulator [Armatimonadetes bacterium]|nr:ArsR family transcriptional regulator [Armatimonadota bacterium]NOG93424.1 winged helix-turn-helix transcriptional regulator [Armatimonadota bacterium]